MKKLQNAMLILSLSVVLFSCVQKQGEEAAKTEVSGFVNADSNFAAPGIVSDPQPLYQLPKDHAFHGGEFFKTNDLMDWNYISIIGTDEATGDTISIFWAALAQGYIQAEKRPVMNGLFLFHNTRTGEFKSGGGAYKGAFKSKGNTENNANYYFDYEVGDDKNNMTLSYKEASKTFSYGAVSSNKSEWFTPYKFNFTAQVQKPGFIPAAYWGYESIGIDSLDRQNPETLYGLTYYYLAPETKVEGTFELDGKTYKIKGNGWFEHQWGNFRNTEGLKYFYGYCRLNDGNKFTWRQYYGAAGWPDPHPEVSRYQYIDTNGRRSHAFGESFRYTPSKYFESAKGTGKRYPWWGKMETPNGTYYTEARWPDQESMGLQGGFIEGTIYFHKASPKGPIVGVGFCELVDLPGQGPDFSRQLPENPLLQYTPWK